MLGFAVALGGFGLVGGPVCLDTKDGLIRLNFFYALWIDVVIALLMWEGVRREKRVAGMEREGWMDGLASTIDGKVFEFVVLA